MGYLDPFIIPFSGLKPGMHTFGFRIDPAFFEQFAHSEITEGTAEVHLDLVRSERMLDLIFRITGSVRVPCDRCGDPLDIPVEGTERLLVKLGDAYEEESDSVLVIPETETRFDVSPHIYDYIHLLIPRRRVHPETGDDTPHCNPEILKKLEELNAEHNPDPRWEALKDLRKS